MKSDLTRIPGIGKSIEQDLLHIGIRCIADLKGKNPEELFAQSCHFKGFQEDRCLLYVFRLAVYYAEHDEYEPEKLKWWYWKDESPAQDSILVTQNNAEKMEE